MCIARQLPESLVNQPNSKQKTKRNECYFKRAHTLPTFGEMLTIRIS